MIRKFVMRRSAKLDADKMILASLGGPSVHIWGIMQDRAHILDAYLLKGHGQSDIPPFAAESLEAVDGNVADQLAVMSIRRTL